MSVASVVNEFLWNLKVEANASNGTIKAYRGDLATLIDECEKRDIAEVDEITTVTIRKLIERIKEETNCKASTLARKINCYRSFFRFCIQQEYITKNPMIPIRTPQQEKTVPTYLNKIEVKKLLAAPERLGKPIWMRDRAALEILIMTGVRRSELISLNWPDLDFGAGTILVRKAKGKKQRLIPMHPVLKEHLWEYLQTRLPLNEPAVIVGREGGRITKNALYNLLKRNLKAAGITNKRVTIHTLRHTFCSIILNDPKTNVNLMHLQELMGHADLGSTRIYSHLEQKRLTDIVTKTHFV